MKTRSLKAIQKIPVPVKTAWAFFSNPANLERITPCSMRFRVTSRFHGDSIYPGQIIEYQLQPFGGIRVNWVTEITHVLPEQLFVDEQRFGPYAFWHHQHHFRPAPGGTEMTDIVHYRIPYGPFGQLADRVWVAGRLTHIFQFRYQEIAKIFGGWEGESFSLDRH